jgi:hypothetical protein
MDYNEIDSDQGEEAGQDFEIYRIELSSETWEKISHKKGRIDLFYVVSKKELIKTTVGQVLIQPKRNLVTKNSSFSDVSSEPSGMADAAFQANRTIFLERSFQK